MKRTMNRRRAVLFLALFATALAGCVSKTTGGADKDPKEMDTGKLMSLYKVEVDTAALKAGGQLLFAEPPPGDEPRRCQGYIQFSDSGYCSAEVKVAEPVFGLSGDRTDHIYTILHFYGKVDSTGTRATIQSGEQPKNVDPGRISELRFRKGDSDNKLEVQAFSGTTGSPYIFYFHKHVLIDRNVPFPWRAD